MASRSFTRSGLSSGRFAAVRAAAFRAHGWNTDYCIAFAVSAASSTASRPACPFRGVCGFRGFWWERAGLSLIHI